MNGKNCTYVTVHKFFSDSSIVTNENQIETRDCGRSRVKLERSRIDEEEEEWIFLLGWIMFILFEQHDSVLIVFEKYKTKRKLKR